MYAQAEQDLLDSCLPPYSVLEILKILQNGRQKEIYLQHNHIFTIQQEAFNSSKENQVFFLVLNHQNKMVQEGEKIYVTNILLYITF